MAEQPSRSPKRRLKNPETFRERSLKAVEANDKPSRYKKITGWIAKLFRPILTPIGGFFHRLGKVQPFKTIYLLLHWIGLVLLPPYIRKSWKELKLVTWPNRKQSRQLTFAVLVFAFVFGAAVAVLDYGLDKIFKQILLK